LRPRRNVRPREKDESKLKAAGDRRRNPTAVPPDRAKAVRANALDAAIYP